MKKKSKKKNHDKNCLDQSWFFQKINKQLFQMASEQALPFLKCCRPNGIPIMVIHMMQPHNRECSAIGIPKKMAQMIFSKKLPSPPPYVTSFQTEKVPGRLT